MQEAMRTILDSDPVPKRPKVELKRAKNQRAPIVMRPPLTLVTWNQPEIVQVAKEKQLITKVSMTTVTRTIKCIPSYILALLGNICLKAQKPHPQPHNNTMTIIEKSLDV